MNLVHFLLGIVLLTTAIVDLLWTTVWVEGGAGPLTSRLMAWSWRSARGLGNRNSWVLSLTGPFIFIAGLTAWILLLWGGWTLIFASAESALIDTLSRGPISWFDLVYFTGYTFFTLGTGDFVPHDGIWQLATTLASGSGLLFVTLSVTYVLSVLDAVTQKRAFASSVTGLGMQSEDLVQASWNGEEFGGLELTLNTLTSQLNTLTTNHKAYPILHYFYSRQPEQASAIGITVLDGALTILRFGVPEQNQPSEMILTNARASVQSYLNTLDSAFIEPAEQSPPSPDLDAIHEVGVPTLSDKEFATSLTELDERRRMLLGLVESDAREWPSKGDK
ncbi:potassium channel family protein [Haladaptatus salinisoli]|uniref:potassium channel family protein n=1 Tax=Haladaptatus salinisoli TaxID=2884876 RepID=UPI001D0B1362|nr:potassium channel family protein [Haladaptatus salinisoli]